MPSVQSARRAFQGWVRQVDPRSEILDVYLGLKAELEQHMAKEEQRLFPLIKSGQGAMAIGPISVMEREHNSPSVR